MLTSKEIRSTTFVSVKKGYATEDVDAFLNTNYRKDYGISVRCLKD